VTTGRGTVSVEGNATHFAGDFAFTVDTPRTAMLAREADLR
jgi:hypothetical protein